MYLLNLKVFSWTLNIALDPFAVESYCLLPLIMPSDTMVGQFTTVVSEQGATIQELKREQELRRTQHIRGTVNQREPPGTERFAFPEQYNGASSSSTERGCSWPRSRPPWCFPTMTERGTWNPTWLRSGWRHGSEPGPLGKWWVAWPCRWRRWRWRLFKAYLYGRIRNCGALITVMERWFGHRQWGGKMREQLEDWRQHNGKRLGMLLP